MSDGKLPLDNIISKLTKAIGNKPLDTLSEAELDQYVSEILTKEAEDRKRVYEKDGVSSLVGKSESSSSRKKPANTNKRFLENIIRQTDSHNKAIMEQQSKKKRKTRWDDEK